MGRTASGRDPRAAVHCVRPWPNKRLKRFTTAVVAGAATGAVFLGVGGRLAMHAFALATARAAGFTLRGSLNVVFAGAITGAIGGLLLAGIDRFLPRPRGFRALLFAAVCYL